MSGTLQSAALAAAAAPVPVHLVDTGTASFGVSACVWAAGTAIARGAAATEVVSIASTFAERVGTAFMIGVPMLTERGGRADDVELDGDGIPVLVMNGGRLEVLARVSTIDDTVDVMATYAATWFERAGGDVTVAVGVADAPSRPLADRLRTALEGVPHVTEIVEYRVGPTVGAHTGPGTFGLFVFPSP
jgi:fatty acid-binding protein DegV